MPILNSINQMLKEMTEWRQHLHQNPEIGLKEYKTSKYVQDKLKSWDFVFKLVYSKTEKENQDQTLVLKYYKRH